MAELGLDPIAAGLVVAVETGDAMVDDLVFDPPLTLEARHRLGLDKSIEDRIAEAERQVRAAGREEPAS